MAYKIDFEKRMSLIDEVAENIMKTGVSKNTAEAIARRWVRN